MVNHLLAISRSSVIVTMFNATFNNISVVSWQSVLLVEETGVPGKTTDLPQVTDKLDHIVSSVRATHTVVIYN